MTQRFIWLGNPSGVSFHPPGADGQSDTTQPPIDLLLHPGREYADTDLPPKAEWVTQAIAQGHLVELSPVQPEGEDPAEGEEGQEGQEPEGGDFAEGEEGQEPEGNTPAEGEEGQVPEDNTPAEGEDEEVPLG